MAEKFQLQRDGIRATRQSKDVAQLGRVFDGWLGRLMIAVPICLTIWLAACDVRVDLGDEQPAGEVAPPPAKGDDPRPAPDQPDHYKPNFSRGLRVELVWNTLGGLATNDGGIAIDPMQTGADLDLHLVHPLARLANPDGLDFDQDGVVDGWFDPIFDAFWDGQRQLWGGPTMIDDPLLDRDAQNGGGPETLYLERPEDGLCYQLGVHVWTDHDLGPSDATLHVFWDDVEIWTPATVRLTKGELWDVASICMSARGLSIAPSGCSPDGACHAKVLHTYPKPAAFDPGSLGW